MADEGGPWIWSEPSFPSRLIDAACYTFDPTFITSLSVRGKEAYRRFGAPAWPLEAIADSFLTMHLDALDIAVMATYGLLVLWIGFRTGRGHQNADELFLGGRRIPAWAAFLSMVATELSAATFIGVPVAAYGNAEGKGGSWSYLQFAFGSLLGKIVLATWFISLYHKMKLVTVYGFLQQRFGRGAQLCGAWFFLGGRLFASGTRLFLGALAFAVVLDIPVPSAILVAGLIALVYTLFGGIRAVIWTDTLQGTVFLVSAVTALVVLITKSEGGFSQIWESANEAGKTQVFFFPGLETDSSASAAWDQVLALGASFQKTFLSSGQPFLVALFGGFFLTLASHGTDQDMVQRLLTTKDGKRGGGALIASGISNFPITFVFLFLGTAMWAYYRPDVGLFDAYAIDDHRRIFPIFVLNELPAGLRGLIFSGLFAAAMSSMDSALNSLATTWVVDIRRDVTDQDAKVRMTRIATVVFGLLLIGASLGCVWWEDMMRKANIEFSLIDLALSSMTILYGGLLGGFLVGLMTNRGTSRSVTIGMLVSGLAGLVLALQPWWTEQFLGEKQSYIAWPWWIIIGTIISFSIGAWPKGTAPAKTR